MHSRKEKTDGNILTCVCVNVHVIYAREINQKTSEPIAPTGNPNGQHLTNKAQYAFEKISRQLTEEIKQRFWKATTLFVISWIVQLLKDPPVYLVIELLRYQPL